MSRIVFHNNLKKLNFYKQHINYYSLDIIYNIFNYIYKIIIYNINTHNNNNTILTHMAEDCVGFTVRD